MRANACHERRRTVEAMHAPAVLAPQQGECLPASGWPPGMVRTWVRQVGACSDPAWLDAATFAADAAYRDATGDDLVAGGFRIDATGLAPASPVVPPALLDPLQAGTAADDAIARAAAELHGVDGAAAVRGICALLTAAAAELGAAPEDSALTLTPAITARAYPHGQVRAPATATPGQAAMLHAWLHRAAEAAQYAAIDPRQPGARITVGGHAAAVIAATVWGRDVLPGEDPGRLPTWRGWTVAPDPAPGAPVVRISLSASSPVAAPPPTPIPPAAYWDEWSNLLDDPARLERALATYTRLLDAGCPAHLAAQGAARLA